MLVGWSVSQSVSMLVGWSVSQLVCLLVGQLFSQSESVGQSVRMVYSILLSCS